MNGDPADSTEGFEDAIYFLSLESLQKVHWNSLGYNRVPAFLINPNSLLESAEEVVSLVEISINVLAYIVPLLELRSSVVVGSELEVLWVDLKVGTDFEVVVVQA
jgi:hypothetical protein